MGVRQPRVQRRQPDLGAVAEQEEDEGEIEQRRIERPGVGNQRRPCHGVDALTDSGSCRQIDEDGAEQSQRDADAAENEILPRRFQGLRGAVDPDHEHGGQRRQFDRHPHQADVVGQERQVHGEHQRLVHRVIEAQIARCETAGLQLVGDIAGAEGARGESHEGVENDEEEVEVVDQQETSGPRPLHEQHQAGDEGGESSRDVEGRRRGGSRAAAARTPAAAAGMTSVADAASCGQSVKAVHPATGPEPPRRRCRTARESGTGRCR